MNLIEDLKLTINLVKQNRMIWWLSILSLLYLLIPVRQNYESLIIALVMLLLSLGSLVISIIGNGALIIAANKLFTVGNFEFNEVWSRSKGRSFHILGIYVRLFPFFLLIIFVNYLIYLNSISLNWLYLERFIITIIGPILILGMCGIVIHDKKALPALKTSLTIFVKMFHRIIPIILLYTLFRWVFFAVVYLLVRLPLIDFVVPEFNVFNYSSLLSLLRLPIFTWANNFISLLLCPYLSLIITAIYSRYISSLEHLDLDLLKTSG